MAVVYENAAVASADFANSLTLAFNAGSAADRFLCVLAIQDRNASTTIDSVTYNGTSMTAQEAQWAGVDFGGQFPRRRLFTLVAPASGSNNIVASYSSSSIKPRLIAACYSGVDQASPISGITQAGASDNAPTWTVSSTGSDLVVAMFHHNQNASAFTPASPATERVDAAHSGGGGSEAGVVMDEVGASSVTINGTLGTSDAWAGIAFSLKAAGGAAAIRRLLLLGVG